MPYFPDVARSPYEALIMASIIERETGQAGEREMRGWGVSRTERMEEAGDQPVLAQPLLKLLHARNPGLAIRRDVFEEVGAFGRRGEAPERGPRAGDRLDTVISAVESYENLRALGVDRTRRCDGVLPLQCRGNVLCRHAEGCQPGVGKFDEDLLGFCIEAKVREFDQIIGRIRPPFNRIKIDQGFKYGESGIARNPIRGTVAPLPNLGIGIYQDLKPLQHSVVGE